MEESANQECYPIELVQVKVEEADSPTPWQTTLADSGDESNNACEDPLTNNDNIDISSKDIVKEKDITSPCEDMSSSFDKVKSDVTLYPCDLCDKVFTSHLAVSGHKASHKDKSPPTNKPVKKRGKKVNAKDDADKKEAVTVDPNAATSFPCPSCDRVFPTINGIYGHRSHHLKSHKRRKVENRKEPRICEKCGKCVTATPAAFRQHLLTHSDDRPFQCDVCAATFPSRFKLTRHLRRHSDKREYTCDVCDKSFVVLSNLSDHKWRMHNASRKAGKPHGCVVCGKSFAKKYHLAEHNLTHTKEKEFECDICLKMFPRQRSVTQHKKMVHADLSETPSAKTEYGCDLCPKVYVTAASVARHKNQVHKNVKYQCDICFKWYLSMSTVKYHKEHVHGDKGDQNGRQTVIRRSESVKETETNSSESSDSDRF